PRARSFYFYSLRILECDTSSIPFAGRSFRAYNDVRNNSFIKKVQSVVEASVHGNDLMEERTALETEKRLICVPERLSRTSH
ncbi:hypothetical protein PMAYCL1PPCAC_23965, partial [Pristionchus mayeri]